MINHFSSYYPSNSASVMTNRREDTAQVSLSSHYDRCIILLINYDLLLWNIDAAITPLLSLNSQHHGTGPFEEGQPALHSPFIMRLKECIYNACWP
jgi:hypothetical protein